MNKQPKSPNQPQDSQASPWSDAELRRVSRVFELLIRVDKRLKKGKSYEEAETEQEVPKHEP